MDTTATSSVRSTGSWVFKWLGILWGSCIVVSLVRRGFAIELQGLPLAIYEQYAWLREALFWPVVEAFKWLGWSIPVWVKDLVMAYGLTGSACARYFSREYGSKDDGLVNAMFFLLWPGVIIFNMISDRGIGVFALEEYAGIARELAYVLVFATAFFLWNHLQNVLGPITG